MTCGLRSTDSQARRPRLCRPAPQRRSASCLQQSVKRLSRQSREPTRQDDPGLGLLHAHYGTHPL